MAPLINRLNKEWREICKHNKASLCMYNLLKQIPLPEGDDIEEQFKNNFVDSEIILFPQNTTTLTEWIAFVNGPPDTPFQGARFQLKIQVSKVCNKSAVNIFVESFSSPSMLLFF